MSNPSNEIRHQSRPRHRHRQPGPAPQLWSMYSSSPPHLNLLTQLPILSSHGPSQSCQGHIHSSDIMLHEMDRVPHKKYISRKPRPRKFIITFWQLSCKLKGPDGSSLWLCEKVGCWMLPNTVCVISPHKEIVLARARWGYNELSSGAAALPTPVPFIFCWFPPWPDLPHLDWKCYFHFLFFLLPLFLLLLLFSLSLCGIIVNSYSFRTLNKSK